MSVQDRHNRSSISGVTMINVRARSAAAARSARRSPVHPNMRSSNYTPDHCGAIQHHILVRWLDCQNKTVAMLRFQLNDRPQSETGITSAGCQYNGRGRDILAAAAQQPPPKTAPISPPGLSFIYFVTCSHKTALVSIFKQSSRQTSNFTIYNLPIQLPYILMKDFGCNDSNRLKLSEDREFSNCIMSFFMLRTKLNANIEC